MTITFFYPLKFFVDRGLIYGAIKTRVEFLMGSEVLTYAFLNCREWKAEDGFQKFGVIKMRERSFV